MTILYNILHLLLLALFWPLLLLVLLKPKYRSRLPRRLGFGLCRAIPAKKAPGQQTIWLHGLSVGEVTSAQPLVASLRQEYPQCRIIVTVTTQTGNEVANTLLAGDVDCIVPAPLDLLPVVHHYLNCISPDLFILVETDFWPNLLTGLNRRRVPTLLVNGRISQKSLAAYRKFAFFFAPLFRGFSQLCMQTAADRMNMIHFGVEEARVHTLGNLKYGTMAATSHDDKDIATYIPENRLVLVAGSTHRGEEKIVLTVYRNLLASHPTLYLLLVPRNPNRAAEIVQLAKDLGLQAGLRTKPVAPATDLLLVDTIGELVKCYRLSEIAFVGGSLVSAGGHNPIEPAALGVPVLFGPHMEDFAEISKELLATGGGMEVADQVDLESSLRHLLTHADLRRTMGQAAAASVQRRHGVIASHLKLIRTLLCNG